MPIPVATTPVLPASVIAPLNAVNPVGLNCKFPTATVVCDRKFVALAVPVIDKSCDGAVVLTPILLLTTSSLRTGILALKFLKSKLTFCLRRSSSKTCPLILPNCFISIPYLLQYLVVKKGTLGAFYYIHLNVFFSFRHT